MTTTVDAAFSRAHFRDAWRALCASIPETRIDAAEGLDFIFSGIPIAFFNVAIVNGDGVTSEELDACGRRALAWAAPAGVPWLFIVTHEALAPGVDATATLDSCGLIPMMPLTGMMAQRIKPSDREASGLDIQAAGDDASCEAVMDINAAAYGVPLDAAKPVY